MGIEVAASESALTVVKWSPLMLRLLFTSEAKRDVDFKTI